jgi:hypothetical protein
MPPGLPSCAIVRGQRVIADSPPDRPAHAEDAVAAGVRIRERQVRLEARPAGRYLQGNRVGADARRRDGRYAHGAPDESCRGAVLWKEHINDKQERDANTTVHHVTSPRSRRGILRRCFDWHSAHRRRHRAHRLRASRELRWQSRCARAGSPNASRVLPFVGRRYPRRHPADCQIGLCTLPACDSTAVDSQARSACR